MLIVKYPRCLDDDEISLLFGSEQSFAQSESSVSVLTSWDIELFLFELAIMPDFNKRIYLTNF